MNRSSIILGIATLAFGSASAYLYNDLSQAREREAALLTRISTLETTGAGTRTQPRPLREQLPNPFTAPGDAPRVASQPSPATANASEPAVARLATAGADGNPMLAWDRSRRLFEDPEYREAMQRQQRMMMPRMYPDLQNVLQLDDEQARQLFDLLADQQTRAMTSARPPFSMPGTQPDETAMREWRTQQQRLQADKDAEIATLLGDAKAQQWKTYQSTMPARAQIRELRSELDTAGMPLQQDQAEKLVTAIATEQQRSMSDFRNTRNVMGPVTSASDRTAMFEQQIERLTQQQQRLHAAAAPHLSSQQMEHFERMQASQLEMQEINLKMIRAQTAAEARGDLPPANQMIQGAIAVTP